MIFSLTKAYYINATASDARRVYMEDQLKRLNLSACRIDAPPAVEANGFQNTMARSNYDTHMTAIRLATSTPTPSLIFEDDVVVRDLLSIEFYYKQVQNLTWDVLYFYGNEHNGLARIQEVVDTHAYVVNPSSADKLLRRLEVYRDWIEKEQPKDWRTFFDRAMIVFQKDMFFYGTNELVYQDRGMWGSALGWGWNGGAVVKN